MLREQNIFKTILKYTIPSVLSMWIFTIYTLVDGIFIGKFVGKLGLEAVTLTMPLINLTFAIGVMIAVGSSTLISLQFSGGN